MKSKLYIIDIFLLLGLAVILFHQYPMVVYGSTEARWQHTNNAVSVWWGLPTGKIWSFTRFYSFGDDVWTMKIWRDSNTSDMIGLKFDYPNCFYWNRISDQWVNLGTYPQNVWLEAILESATHFGFSIQYAVSDVPIHSDLDMSYELAYDLSLDREYGWNDTSWRGIDDVFQYELYFQDGSIAFDYTDTCSCQELFFYPTVHHIIEEYDDGNYSNWNTANVNCSDVYYTIDTGETPMTIGKFWTSGGEPSTPQWEDVDQPWYEHMQEQFLYTLQHTWENIRETLSNIPIIGDFLTQLWGFLDTMFLMLGDIWKMAISNLPAIALLVLLGYFFTMLTAILHGDVKGIRDAFTKPLEWGINLIQTIVGIVGRIVDFLKFW